MQRASWKTHSIFKYFQFETWGGPYLADLAIGVAMFGVLLLLTLKHQDNQASFWVLRFLESRFVLRLGAISYSLYLIHMPLLQLLTFLAIRLGASPASAPALFILGPALGLLVAWGFHHLFERPFMSDASPWRRTGDSQCSVP
jgi:peptidoglycan/LPS O-acetylase OafA/YrhL